MLYNVNQAVSVTAIRNVAVGIDIAPPPTSAIGAVVAEVMGGRGCRLEMTAGGPLFAALSEEVQVPQCLHTYLPNTP